MDLGLFQKNVAKSIGVSTNTIILLERGRTAPNKKNMRKIKEFLKLRSELSN